MQEDRGQIGTTTSQLSSQLSSQITATVYAFVCLCFNGHLSTLCKYGFKDFKRINDKLEQLNYMLILKLHPWALESVGDISAYSRFKLVKNDDIPPDYNLYHFIGCIAPWIRYLVIYVISSTFNNIMLIYLKAKDFNKLYSVMSILQAFLLICFNITFLILLKWGIRGYLLSTILASLITGIVAFILSSAYKDLRDAKLNKPLLIEMVKYSSPLILNSISWGIIHSSDKVMLEMMMGGYFGLTEPLFRKN